MMKRVLLLSAALLAAALSASAVTLVGTEPSNGQAGVGTTGDLVLQFSGPLDPDVLYYNYFADGSLELPVMFLLAEPDGAFEVEGYSLEEGGTELVLSLVMQPDTDFSFIVGLATGMDGSSLSAPGAVSFSTAAAMGTHSISGTITADGVPGRAVVAIQEASLFAPENRFELAGLAGPDGNYMLGFVRPGVHYPVAAQDVDGDGIIDVSLGHDRMGYYDPNQDGEPDSVLVAGSNLTGINIDLNLVFTWLTAREALETAGTLAQDWDMEATLRQVVSATAPDAEGRCNAWSCLYTSTQQTDMLVVIVGAFGIDMHTTPDTGNLASLPALPDEFVDSDVIRQAGMDNGGLDFINEHDGYVEHLVTAGAQPELWSDPPNRLVWTYQFYIYEGDSLYQHMVAVDLVTGEVLNGTAVDPAPAVPAGMELACNTPNPFNPSTVIHFTLPTAGPASLTVFDMLGRRVATLVEGPLAAGAHSIRFDGSALASGVYGYTLEAGGARLSRTMVLVK